MPDLSHKQQEALQDSVRFDLYELLRKAETMSLSLIGAQKPFLDLELAQISYHLKVLVEVQLVVLEEAGYRIAEEGRS
jgi:DNA-binding transcriptional ArsR family regulator